MHPAALSIYISALAFLAFLGIRISVTGNILHTAINAVHRYNLATLDQIDYDGDMVQVDAQCKKLLLDYDTAIRDFDEVMWDFTAWSTCKAFVNATDFEKCDRMEESA